MICVRLEGGLGNQLFQYAAARALALRLNTQTFYDDALLHQKRSAVTSRELELGAFRCVAQPFINRIFILARFAKYIAPISKYFFPYQILTEKSSCDLSYFAAQGNLYLAGYWQSYRYFENYSIEISRELLPCKSLSLASQEIHAHIKSCSESVAIHVRRGDYVSHGSAASFHGALDVDYYKKAVSLMRNRLFEPHFFVYSDDIAWCKENLNLSNQVRFIENNDKARAWEDLVLMRDCQHHIIANSSFSWWGAWLADVDNKVRDHIVIAPKNWFRGKKINLTDRFPSHWILI